MSSTLDLPVVWREAVGRPKLDYSLQGLTRCRSKGVFPVQIGGQGHQLPLWVMTGSQGLP